VRRVRRGAPAPEAADMRIALDPYMLRRVPLTDLPGLVADLGYEYLELSPRADFLPFFLYCAPHTFHQGGDIEGIMRYAGARLTQVHLADSFDHRGSSGLRYIVNPPGSTARVHQHLDIGQGEVDWDVFFRTLAQVGFDGIATVCVFAWEERARESSVHNLEQVRAYLAKYGGAAG
jgi:sugar phosphate isomerase/epimerase